MDVLDVASGIGGRTITGGLAGGESHGRFRTSTSTRPAICPLQQRMIENMTVRRFSEHTKRDYVRQVAEFTAYRRAKRGGLAGALDISSLTPSGNGLSRRQHRIIRIPGCTRTCMSRHGRDARKVLCRRTEGRLFAWGWNGAIRSNSWSAEEPGASPSRARHCIAVRLLCLSRDSG